MHGGGILCLARSEYGIAWFTPVFEDLQSLGFEGTIETLTPEAAREIEPSLGDDARFVVRTSVDRYVRPESLMAGLAAKLRGQGVELREQVDVTGLQRNGAGWTVETSGGAVEAEAVVVDGRRGDAAAAAALRPARADRGRQGLLAHAAGRGRGAAHGALPVRAQDRRLRLRRRRAHRGHVRAARPRPLGRPQAHRLHPRRHAAVHPRLEAGARRGRAAGLGRLPARRRPTASRCSARSPARTASTWPPATACSASRSPRPRASRSPTW